MITLEFVPTNQKGLIMSQEVLICDVFGDDYPFPVSHDLQELDLLLSSLIDTLNDFQRRKGSSNFILEWKFVCGDIRQDNTMTQLGELDD